MKEQDPCPDLGILDQKNGDLFFSFFFFLFLYGMEVSSSPISPPAEKQKVKINFFVGNVHEYYFQRLEYNEGSFYQDKRMRFLKPEWFEGKSMLDIGCNVGVLSLLIGE